MRVLVILASFLAVALAGKVGYRMRTNGNTLNKLEKLAADLKDRLGKISSSNDLKSLQARVNALTGSGCGSDEFACDNHDGCVNKLLVCDGLADCNDGSDESDDTCNNPVTPGSSWGGYVTWQACKVANNGQVRVLVTNAEEQEDITSELHLDATTFLYSSDNSYTTSFAEGWYAFGTRTWWVRNTGGHGLGNLEIKCEFDGYNYDSCQGVITRIGHKEPCAELRLFRE